MVERAAAGLVDRHGPDAIADVDVLITHTQMPDMPFYGGGGGMAHRLGMKPELGDRPAQRRLRGIRARPEDGPATARSAGRAAPR